MQNKLVNDKPKVRIKESYGGFEVTNGESVAFHDVTPKPFRYGSKMVEKHDSYEDAKKYYEDYCKESFNADVEWVKSKHQDQRGKFWLNGVLVNWELRVDYITLYHIDFNTHNRESCLLTETGYRSLFPSNLDAYDDINEFMKDYVEYELTTDYNGKKKKCPSYTLSFEEEGYKPSRQLSLFEMKGGVN